jgi:hypothetical protein
MINKDYKNAISELYKLKKIGILNKKNNDRWLACLKTITDNRRIIIKNLHTLIRSELLINSLPKNVYEYFKDDLRFREVDAFFINLKEYYKNKKQNTELQQKQVVDIKPFTMFKSPELQQTKNPTSVYKILQDYFYKEGIVYNYPDNITLSDIDIFNLTFECEKFFKIEIGENILDCKNTDKFICFVSKIIENN